nr:hypothetical protein [Tanacetum cinerariifolium]
MVGPSPSGSFVVDSINNLDAGNPLHVQNSDNSNSVIIPFKLLGTENYRICKELGLHQQLMKLMQFLMGLNDCYQPVRSSLLIRDPLPEVKDAYNVISREESHRGVLESFGGTGALMIVISLLEVLFLIRDPLPEVKDAYNVISREESHRGVLESFGGTESKQNATSFVAKTFNNNTKQFNNNGNNFTRGTSSNVNRGPNPNLNCEHCGKIGHTIDSMSLTTITLGWIIDSGDNQHLTGSTSRMVNVADISDLKITVGHPNGTLVVISHVGNLKLANNVMLYDVLVVLRYCVSLLSVNKLIRDNKMFVGFDENRCYIQDLKREKILGTRSESGGLYLFDVNKSNCIGQSNMVMNFHVSKLLWHNRLGHHADQVLSVLKKDLNIFDNTSVPILPSSVLNGKTPYELVYNKKPNLSHLSLKPQTPNDDGRDSSNEEGSLPHTDIHDSTQGRNQSDGLSATQIGDQNWSEGNIQNVSQSSPTQNKDDVQTPVIRRSERNTRPPVRFNDYILNFNVKYGIEKYVSYSRLSSVNMCFAVSLNKSVEPTCLIEALSDPNWVEAMNNEIEALNRNNTWTVCDLLVGRKPIGSKWIWKIKYKASGDIEIYKARLVAKDVYMTLPDGYNNVDKSKVCKLNKSLYGLKQAPRQWNANLTTALAEHGFEQSKFDYSLYTKHRSGMFIALLVYVDDIVITGSDVEGINEFKLFLSTKFLIKDLGALKYFLGIETGPNVLKLENLLLVSVYFGKTIVSWKSKKQATISKSSSEAEYRSRSSASCEVVWLGNMLHGIGLKDLYPVELCCDNSSAIQISVNPIFHKRTKHFELDVHFVREKVLAGVIKTVKVCSNLQTADVFTKCLGVVQHKLCCKSLDLLDIFAREPVDKVSGRKSQAPKKKFYLLDDEWSAFVVANVLVQTTTMHFILQGIDDHYVTVYDAEGSECPGYERRKVGRRLVREDIRYTMMRSFGQRKPLYHKRMKQFCNWPNHADHVNEDHMFYTSLCAYVTDACKLTIPTDFYDVHATMHTYTKAYVVHFDVGYSMKVEMVYYALELLKTNHVVMKGLWRKFGKDCGFVEPKMMRM